MEHSHKHKHDDLYTKEKDETRKKVKPKVAVPGIVSASTKKSKSIIAAHSKKKIVT